MLTLNYEESKYLNLLKNHPKENSILFIKTFKIDNASKFIYQVYYTLNNEYFDLLPQPGINLIFESNSELVKDNTVQFFKDHKDDEGYCMAINKYNSRQISYHTHSEYYLFNISALLTLPKARFELENFRKIFTNECPDKSFSRYKMSIHIPHNISSAPTSADDLDMWLFENDSEVFDKMPEDIRQEYFAMLARKEIDLKNRLKEYEDLLSFMSSETRLLYELSKGES